MRLTIAAAFLCLAAIPASAESGRDLLKICGQSASLCNSDFQSDDVMAALKTNACLPADAAKEHTAIMDWLGKHPKAAGLSITEAVTQAADALWPCDASVWPCSK